MELSKVTQDRLGFLEIDKVDSEQLAKFRPVLHQHIDTILDKFYGKLASYPHLMAKFQGESALLRARDAQKRHWHAMFEGVIDEAYINRANQVGKSHERIGLEPRWYIGGYAMVLAQVVNLVFEHHRTDMETAKKIAASIIKILMLDIDLGISSYFDESKKTHQQEINAIADSFEATFQEVVEEIRSASELLNGSSSSLAAASEETQAQVKVVSSASAETAANVQTVAAAAEQFSASIKEISRQVAESADVSKNAVTQSNQTNASMLSLAEASKKIEQVVKLINTVASQTQLLALNATIEASRAGEAGKGFAVVASEVKGLSIQTATATKEISSQVAAIQSATQTAIERLEIISKTICDMNGVLESIATAVEQQSKVTLEIARSASVVANHTNEVSTNIVTVSQAAQESGKQAETVFKLSTSLNNEVDKLSHSVTSFGDRLRKGVS